MFQTPEMRDLYAAATNYDPLLFAALKEGELRGILLAFVARYGGIKGLLSSRSFIWGGPLVSDNDQEIAKLLIRAHERTVKGKVLFSQVKNWADPTSLLIPYESCGYEYHDHLNRLIDLSHGEACVLSGMRKKRRKAIKDGLRENMATRLGDKKDLRVFYEMLREVFHKKARIPLPEMDFFSAVFDVLVPKGRAQLFICGNESGPMAGLLCLLWRGTMYAYYGGSFMEHLGHFPNEIVYWGAMQWGIQRGYRVFDFGGAGRPDEEFGVREFKRRFGGQEVNFGLFHKVESPVKMAIAEVGFALYRHIF